MCRKNVVPLSSTVGRNRVILYVNVTNHEPRRLVRAGVPAPCRICSASPETRGVPSPGRSLRSLAPLRAPPSLPSLPPPPAPASSLRLCPCPTFVSWCPPPGSGDPRRVYVYLQPHNTLTNAYANNFKSIAPRGQQRHQKVAGFLERDKLERSLSLAVYNYFTLL